VSKIELDILNQFYKVPAWQLLIDRWTK